MRWISEFKDALRRKGLQEFGRYYSFYRGKVYDNKDPEQLGRLRVLCPQIYGEESPSMWVPGKGLNVKKGYGHFDVPEVNDPIFISFEEGDVNYPVWEFGWWVANTMPTEAKTDYPQNKVIKTKSGHVVEINDKQKYLRVQTPDDLVIELKDGKFKLLNKDESLGDLMKQLFTALESTKVATAIGAQPFINLATYTELKAKFKKLLE